jgi:hypothetical protein
MRWCSSSVEERSLLMGNLTGAHDESPIARDK